MSQILLDSWPRTEHVIDPKKKKNIWDTVFSIGAFLCDMLRMLPRSKLFIVLLVHSMDFKTYTPP